MLLKYYLLFVIVIVLEGETARILAVFPGPSISHQMVFRPITQELAKRGHEVFVITTDPAFAKGDAPANLTEIDIHDISYEIYRNIYCKILKGNNDMFTHTRTMAEVLLAVFEAQYKSDAIQDLLKKNIKFDLVITEAYFRLATVYAYIAKAPAMLLSSFGFVIRTGQVIGAPIHPLYPSPNRQRIVNLTTLEKINEVYREIWSHKTIYAYEEHEDALLKKLIPEAPNMLKIFNNVQSIMLNVPPMWEWNRPVPPSTVFLGWSLDKPKNNLPQDLQMFLDSSKHGVIYMSFGTNVIESLLPSAKIDTFVEVFSQLPYDVIWKWTSDEVPVKSEKIKFFKWLPQSDLLRHPKIKLFITHGGLHSSDEAIAAVVPLIVIPISLDQWYNAEHYIKHGIGVKLFFETITEELLKNTIERIISNDSYRRNIAKLRSVLYDQPQSPLERVVWCVEHMLRHGGALHLRAPAANMSWAEYLELELIGIIILCLLSVILTVILSIYKLKQILKSEMISKCRVKNKQM